VAVVDIKILRKAGGQSTTSGAQYDVFYRVTTNSDQDGPLTVLTYFPVGRPQIYYLAGPLWKPDDKIAPPKYTYPWPNEKCNSQDLWENTGTGLKVDGKAFLTSASIVSRELGDKSLTTWIVKGTFTREDTEGTGSAPTVVPYYIDEDEVQNYASFVGPYARYVLNTPIAGESQPGYWQPLDEEVLKGGALEGQVSDVDGGFGTQKPIATINSAGMMFDPPMRQRIGRPAFRVTWFSYAALDFTNAIGRVNSNAYVLAAWDVGQSSLSAGAAGSYGSPLLIYQKVFNKRELLVNDVTVDKIRWGGRNNYRYTVELVFDLYGHDKFLLDKGRAKKSSPKSPGETGEKIDPEKTPEGSTPAAPITGPTGQNVNSEVLLDGGGEPLLKYDNDGLIEIGPDDGVWLRYRINEEVEFPTSVRTADVQYHTFDPNSKCPLMMDGGDRYLNGNPTPWP